MLGSEKAAGVLTDEDIYNRIDNDIPYRNEQCKSEN